MLFGRQDNTQNSGTTADDTHNDYVSSLSDAAQPSTNPALPPDDSIFAPNAGVSTDATATEPAQTNQPREETTQETVAPEEASPFAPQPTTDTAPNDVQGDDLLGLKQEALDHLTPLVDHLEQTPEEKFRTTMMMIQSTDNQSLLKDAFAAAKEIQDDKARAQALLDVINEINYFTQKG